MDTAKMAEVLGHQLKGIMLHVDLYKKYLQHKNRRCAMKHYRHAVNEMKNFMLTNEYIIESMNEIVEPTKEAQIMLPEEEEKLHNVWQQYEHDTMLFYNELMVDNPKCCWWRKLHDAAAHEIIKY